MVQRAKQCYKLIDERADRNSIIQGASGFFGVGTALVVDAISIPIYGQMWNDIRAIYGQPPVNTEEVKSVIKSIIPEMIADVAVDKLLGNIPIIGSYFNAACGKHMTWRLGTLFSVMASRGEDINHLKYKETMVLIRHLFPITDAAVFSSPNYDDFINIVSSVAGNSINELNLKVERALAIFNETPQLPPPKS